LETGWPSDPEETPFPGPWVPGSQDQGRNQTFFMKTRSQEHFYRVQIQIAEFISQNSRLGHIEPTNRSPSPYSPFPVLENRRKGRGRLGARGRIISILCFSSKSVLIAGGENQAEIIISERSHYGNRFTLRKLAG